ncbi:hypothetical protein GCM10010960_09030 [Arenimonas maotaiensis]|uniref:Uncharacterized protein n=1 Tax=Arenimonas maotaiensis TaxID=1446479 RepID=A0A917CKM4_9GAMM|nr:hypothetical protein [Arenimonas maotaiensis]GGF89373.1 hypothetical protein GCM10010960_09030 [Arenimonas maotaiensis]
MKLPAPAVIWINRPDNIHTRIAAFTWPTKSGFAWLEDSYLDPYGCNHAFHALEGKLIERSDGIYLELDDGYALIFSQEQVRADPELCPEDIRDGLMGVQAFFAEQGKDWEQEFARMTEELKSELNR